MEKESLELIRRIAMVVGHELRNPLAVINNSAYYLKTKLASEGRLDPKVEKHLGMVASEISRLDRMIGDILSYSRPLAVKAAPSSLNACLERALEDYPFPESISLKKELAREEPQAPLDEAAFQDCLRRILDNAVEAMPGGGTLTVATQVTGDGISLEVRDSGPGIKPEALACIFEPFLTTKPRGLGLGLALARRVVEALGARFEARNLEKEGAAFRILWP